MSVPTGPIRVLHVDDDPAFVDMAASFLEREDDRITVRTATGAEDGLAVLAEEAVDCVVSDYEMPGRNGIEFLEAVREDHPELPFILYTGKGSEAVASDAISAGVTDYLQKESGTGQYAVLANRIRNAVETFEARAELADREKRLNLFFEQSPLGVVEWDEEFRLARMNDAAEEILGFTEEQLLGESWERIVPASDREEVGDVVSALLENQGGYHSINENVRGDGERIVCEWHNRVVSDEDSVVAVFSQFQDITDRREQQRTVEQQQERLDTVVSNLPVIVFALDPDGTFTLSKGRGLTKLGLEPGEVVGDSVFDLYGDHDDIISKIRRALDGERVEATHEIDGGVFDTTYQPVFDDDGSVRALIGVSTDITERQERERELERNNTVLRAIVENLPMSVLAEDADRDILVANSAPCELLTVPDPAAELVGRDCASAAEGVKDAFADPDEFVDGIERRIREREPVRNETLELADGRTLERDYVPYTLPEGEASLWLYRDVTERRKRERRLEMLHEATRDLMAADTREEVARRAVKDVREILGMSINGCWLHDPETEALTPVAWTEESDAHLGDPPVYHEGESLSWEVFESGELRAYDDVSTQPGRYESGTAVRAEIILPLGDHGVMNIGSPEVKAFDEQDIWLAGLYATNVESALDRAARETELREERAFFDAAVNSLDDLFYVLDATGAMVRWNERVPEVTGYTDEEIAEMDAVEFFAEEDRDRVAEAIGGVLEDRRASVEVDLRTSDGDLIPYEFNGALLPEIPGEGPGLVGTGRDITERKQRERTLEQRNHRLEEFASIVSHDLRNPLNVAIGRLELAREEGDTEHLAEVAGAHERMRVLIEELLALARDGDGSTEIDDVSLAAVAEDCWQHVDTAAATLAVETDRTVRADESRLRQLLANLFRNAVEHGGEDVTVTVGDLPDGFYVADDGPGIPPADRERVFETGYSMSTRGTGYGLSIVDQVVDDHGWSIDVTEGPGGGTRFEITGVDTRSE